VPVFIGALTNANTRRSAIHALEQFGPDARAAVPNLILCLHDASPDVRESARMALERIAPETVSEPAVIRLEYRIEGGPGAP
jgi:HEAT repeat protein